MPTLLFGRLSGGAGYAPPRHAHWLVAVLAMAQLVSWGSIYYGFSLFILPMEQDLGWSRTAMNGALSTGLLVSGLCAYPVGRHIDRHGGRGVMTAGSLAAGLLFALWSVATTLPVLFLVWIGLGAAMGATLYDPLFAVITRRFPGSFRQKIIAVTLIGGFASTVFIPLTQMLVTQLGWRDALLALGLANLVICVPIHWFCLGENHQRGERVLADASTTVPAAAADPVVVPAGIAGRRPAIVMDVLSLSASVDTTGRSALNRALHHPAFWGLVISFTCYYASFAAMTFHLVPLLNERRFPTATIVIAMALIGPAQVLARILLLSIGPRMHAASAGQVTVLAFTLSILLLISFPDSTPALVLSVLIYGGANGMLTIIRGMAVPDMLWPEGYGAINGAIGFPANMAKALGPFGAALVWSAWGSYQGVLLAVLAVSIVSAVAFRYAVAHAATRHRHR